MSSRKRAVFFLLLLLISALPLGHVEADGEAWLTGWGYRKQHTITGTTAGAQTMYQVPIITYFGEGEDGIEEILGIDYGEVYLNSEALDDFGDVRFTASDGETELDYWMEWMILSTSAQFWIEIPNIPEDPDSVNFYIYYGKIGESTTSNGEETAWDGMFDDFESYVIDDPVPTVGTIWDPPMDAVVKNDPDAEGHGQIALLTKTSAYGYLVTDVFTKLYPIAIRFWVRRSSNVLRDGYFYIFEDADISLTTRTATGNTQHYSTGAYRNFNPVLTATTQTWELWEARIYDNDIHVLNDGLDCDGALRFPISTGLNKVRFTSGQPGYTGIWRYDDFFIRKFAVPEPAHDAWGEEETDPGENGEEEPPPEEDMNYAWIAIAIILMCTAYLLARGQRY